VVVLSRPTVDLLPTTVTAPAAGVAGSTITVSAIVANPGTTAASASLLSFYLTTGGTPTRGDLLLGTANINPLEAGDSQMAAGQVTLPASLAPGLYTIGAIADSSDQVLERDEANNALAGNTINVTAPQVDLVVQGVTSPLLAKNAKPINLGATLANQGLDAAPSATVRWYLSSDATITADDLPLGSVAAEPLAPGASTTTGLAVRIPNTVPEGNYFIGAIVDPDNVVGETDNANNTAVNGTPVTVQYLVDLVMTSVTGPAAAATGQSVTFNGRIKNRGLEAVEGEVTVGFYVSGDETIGPRDRLIATTKIDGLAAGAVKAVSATAVLRTDLPKRDFYVGAIADPGNLVPEFRNGNNELAAVNLLTVTHGPDLVVAAVQAPAEVECNRSFVVDLTVTNQGTGAIGAASDQAVIAKGSNIEVGIYLSTNAGITVSDTLVGTATFSALEPGASLPLSVNVTLPPNLAPGLYYIGAMADRGRVLREASNANNALAGNRITVR
jgi:large repetitive protein